MNNVYFDKMHMLYNQNKSCVKSCQKTLLKKKPHCFPTCALFYPIVLKRKIITAGMVMLQRSVSECLSGSVRNFVFNL